MPENDDLDFGSLFDESPKEADHENTVEVPSDELFSFDEIADEEPNLSQTAAADTPIEEETDDNAGPNKKKRSSQDFEPNMDALLLTAQSAMIIEGTKNMMNKNFSSRSLPVYTEAIRGIELYIKILERNPNNYHKLSEIISTDIDCREVEKIAFNIYKGKYSDTPSDDSHKLLAFEMFRDRLKNAYYKSLITQTMVGMKKYFLMAGTIDEAKISESIKINDISLKTDIAKISQYTNIALDLIKNGNSEIARGMKGKEMNIFIIRASEVLAYYYGQIGRIQTADYYDRLHETYRKYFVIR